MSLANLEAVAASQCTVGARCRPWVTYCRKVMLDKRETLLPLIPQLRTYLGGTDKFTLSANAQFLPRACAPKYVCSISYSITSSACTSSEGGTVRPSALATLTLTLERSWLLDGEVGGRGCRGGAERYVAWQSKMPPRNPRVRATREPEAPLLTSGPPPRSLSKGRDGQGPWDF